MTTENKYKRAAKFLADSGQDKLRTYGELLDTQSGVALLDLAAALPEGEAERVLKAAAEAHYRAEHPRWVTCPMCHGTGETRVLGEMERCARCDGAGDVSR